MSTLAHEALSRIYYKSYGCNITHCTNTNDTPAPFLIGLAVPAKIIDPLRNLDLTDLAMVPITQTHATFTFMFY